MEIICDVFVVRKNLLVIGFVANTRDPSGLKIVSPINLESSNFSHSDVDKLK